MPTWNEKTLYRTSSIHTADGLVGAFERARKYLTDAHLTQPLWPDEIVLRRWGFVFPCQLKISQVENSDGLQFGILSVIQSGDKTVWRQPWDLANSEPAFLGGAFGEFALNSAPLNTSVLNDTSITHSPPEIIEEASVSDSVSAEVIPGQEPRVVTGTMAAGEAVLRGVASVKSSPIWANQGLDLYIVIGRAEDDLKAMLAFARERQVANANNLRAHNDPPGLVDAPELDVVALETALAAVVVLKRQVGLPEPDPLLLTLIFNALQLGLQAVGKLLTWAAERGAQYVSNVLDSASKSPRDAAGWYLLISGILNGRKSEIGIVADVVRGVLKSLGH